MTEDRGRNCRVGTSRAAEAESLVVSGANPTKGAASVYVVAKQQTIFGDFSMTEPR
jgi:hypothetical protein